MRVVSVWPIVRPLLFRLDPETAHGVAMAALRAVQAVPPLAARLRRGFLADAPALRQMLFGREVLNPVGLAAGFDKDAVAVRGLAALGFGCIEIGTVTPKPQAGNPRPRLFRHPAAESVQNAMGFNNAGLDAVRARLLRLRPSPVPLGVNIGKNKATPAESAVADYELLVRAFADLCDYLVVNISSPNTPGLRDLQNEGFLRAVLHRATGITGRPILVKIAPDLEEGDAVRLAEVAVDAGAAGVVATNTTNDYSLLPGAKDFGGLSGAVLREKSFRIFDAVARRLYGRALLVSVGGIGTGAEAYRRLQAGASLVQVYSALVYAGPGLARRINEELLQLMERDGAKTITEVIGAGRGK
ncbi:MAG TPA: dihydroorotate dehydrogenase (quinone) [Acidobacteria bacterium]|nr:dihydroorotate dehydrogenase (quinone) [Acidobacteriota bacterium]